MANKFIIPSPWDPGYAIPKNIRKEGLERHAFVTQWTPRGTYDDPDPYDPSWDKSYAVPDYILGEGYGQGARVTDWAPRGSYVGQVPAPVAKIAAKIATTQKALGDAAVTTMPPLFQKYGQRAAATILAQIRALPAPMRKDSLRKIMNAIDPTLYGTTARYAAEYIANGVDANTALELAMARAMSSGIAEELVDIGKKGRRPGIGGQVAMGCYGLAGLGIIPKGNLVQTASTGVVGTTTTIAPGDVTGATVPGGQIKYLELGPFKIPENVTKYDISQTGPLPAEWQSAIVAQISRETDTFGTAMVDATPGKIWNRLRTYIPNLPAKINQHFLGISSRIAKKCRLVQQSAGGAVAGGTIQFKEVCVGAAAEQPIVRTVRPDTGEEWGLFMWLGVKDENKEWDSTTNPEIFHLSWRKVPTNVFDFILKVISKIVEIAAEILDKVGDLACKLLGSSGAKPAGAAVGAYYGGEKGAEAGSKGVGIAQEACGAGPPPPPPTEEESSWILPAAIIGGSVLALVLFLPKKKKVLTP